MYVFENDQFLKKRLKMVRLIA